MAFEFIWHIIFGEPDVVDPLEHSKQFDLKCKLIFDQDEWKNAHIE